MSGDKQTSKPESQPGIIDYVQQEEERLAAAAQTVPENLALRKEYSQPEIRELGQQRDHASVAVESLEETLAEQLDRLGYTEDQVASAVLNHEGQPAFERGVYERTIQVLMTNTMEGTFYANQETIARETYEALTEMAQEDPEFLAKALVYARNEGLLQLVPVVGATILSTIEDKSWFKKVFPRIIATPDNLRSFVKVCKSGKYRKGLGGVATDAVREWLGNLSEYHAVKYSGDAKSQKNPDGTVENKFSLRDMIVLTHPKPDSPEMAERYAWLVKGVEDPETMVQNPKIKAFEELKRATTDEERIARIKDGGLPWEVVIPAVPKMTPELWEAMMSQMPYMALLRNINNLRKYQVLDSDANVEYLCNRLTDRAAIAKAKILPFRFYEAYLAYAGRRPKNKGWRRSYSQLEAAPGEVDSRITAALEEALEASFVNLPALPGKLAIASDVSGSMFSPINAKGSTQYIDICGVFTGALLKKAEGRVHALPFTHNVLPNDLSGEDRIMKVAEELVAIGGGGTALGAPLQELLRTGQSVDAFIGITDNEDWAYGGEFDTSGSFLNLWRQYRKQVNPEAQAFLIRIDPYSNAVAPEGEPNTHFIYGWSDSVPSYISQIMQGKESQVEEVMAMEL
jgi:60 kDa SS-A/Ro ribonucleoprotein